MQINKLGEFRLIERLSKRLPIDRTVLQGSGDDCAVLRYQSDKYLLFTCDMIIEGVDFLSTEKPELIGRKALAVSLSDIAACGGIPRYALVSLGVPKTAPLRQIEGITKGLIHLAKEYNLNVVGGDFSHSPRIVIDVSMLGVVERKNLVLRRGAKPGDIICVTGALGGARRGRHLKFTPRLKISRSLVQKYRLHAMIDISDGLIQDLSHILQQSRVGAILYEELIPLAKEADGLDDALYSGEDFELLFTLSRREAYRLCYRGKVLVYPIGEITNMYKRVVCVGRNGKEKILPIKGFQHF